MADAISSCSACDSRSAATYLELAVSSASTITSDGPAMESMLTCPYTARFARATNMFPGPTILSTLGTDSVPYARAAMACAPPALYISSTPASFAATSVVAYTSPSALHGVVMTIFSTPATFAGITFIRTDEG